VIVPGGNLANSSALGKGFAEMKHLGLISRVPKISVIQAQGANPLYRSWTENGGESLSAVKADTRATAIKIGNPASWKKCVRVIKETGGWVEEATEQEIAIAKAEIGSEGIGCEPASAVTFAGVKKLVAQGKITKEERTVLILTGHTLKDPNYTIDFHNGSLFADMPASSLQHPPVQLEANTDAVIRLLEPGLK
jgi:threonine synthase